MEIDNIAMLSLRDSIFTRFTDIFRDGLPARHLLEPYSAPLTGSYPDLQQHPLITDLQKNNISYYIVKSDSECDRLGEENNIVIVTRTNGNPKSHLDSLKSNGAVVLSERKLFDSKLVVYSGLTVGRCYIEIKMPSDETPFLKQLSDIGIKPDKVENGEATITNPRDIAALAIAGLKINRCDELVRQYTSGLYR